MVGETPNLAARLQALAEPDACVIAESTRRQIGSLFELRDLGPQRLKGFAEPQRAWRVISENRFQDFATPSAIRAVNQNLSVKPSGTQQCGIKHFWAIGRRDRDYARAGIKAIQLGEKLIERLLFFIIAAERAWHAAAPQRVGLVNEDNTGRRSSGLFE